MKNTMRLIIMGILTASVFSSCTKKQIKKEEPVQQQEQSQQPISIKTETTEMEQAFGDEPNEFDVRKKIASSLKPIYFDFDKYNLTPQAREVLSQNAKIIIENDFNIIIEGHCDERGTEQYNLSLGQKRANSVKEYYIRLGVNPSKIATISYGEEMPVCREKTEECWALNRRAETKVTE